MNQKHQISSIQQLKHYMKLIRPRNTIEPTHPEHGHVLGERKRLSYPDQNGSHLTRILKYDVSVSHQQDGTDIEYRRYLRSTLVTLNFRAGTLASNNRSISPKVRSF